MISLAGKHPVRGLAALCPQFVRPHRLSQPYIFTYFYGLRLLEPLLQGGDCIDVFGHLLTEPLLASGVRQEASRQSTPDGDRRRRSS